MGSFAAIAIILVFSGIGAWLLLFAERERERQMRFLEQPWMAAYYRGIGAIFIAFALFVVWNFAHGGILAPAEAAQVSLPLWSPMPDVAELPQANSSREICDRASQFKSRFRTDSVHTAILGYVVKLDGMIHDITVAGSSGNKQLDVAIAACVATLRFRPPEIRRAMMVQWK